MAVNLQMKFSNPFCSIKIAVFWSKFHLNMFSRIQLAISQYWFRSKPLGRHFTLPNHTPDVNHITSHILAFITKPSNTSAAQQMRLKFEREWIYRLRTNLPHGLNAMDWRCHFYPYPLPYSTFFLTPCFMGLVGAIDITSSQSFITLRDNGSLLTNHASTPPMGKFLSCSKSFPPRAPPADPTALISWRGIDLGFPKPQCRRSSPILVIFPAITLFWWPPHLAMAPSSGTILIWRHNQVVVMTQ